MCIYKCIYIYVCINICIHMYIYIYMYVYTYHLSPAFRTVALARLSVAIAELRTAVARPLLQPRGPNISEYCGREGGRASFFNK